MEKEKLYQITMTESQLRLISHAVEDWCRFLSGQCELDHATSYAKDIHGVREMLNNFIRPYIVPELRHIGQSYDWAGNGCPNEHQKKAIAMSYMIYREIIHYLTTHNDKDNSWNVYNSPTLTCKEQGPLIKIEEVNNGNKTT